MTFEFNAGGGESKRIKIPTERIAVPADSPLGIGQRGALFYAHDGPAWNWNKDTYSTFLLDPDAQALSDFKVAVAAISPATSLRVPGEHLDLLELAQNQRGVVNFGVVMGFLIAILAFGISAIDNAVERRRDVAVLLVVGMRRRTIRMTQIIQLLAALIIVLLVASAAGYLAGNLALRLNDVNRDWYAGVLDAMLPFTAASLIVAVCAGSFLAVGTLRSEDLKRE